MYKELALLRITIEDMHARSFPTYPIIEEILVQKILDNFSLKGKDKATKGEGDKRLRKKQKRKKNKDNIEKTSV